MRRVTLSGNKMKNKKELHAYLARKLDFPSYYGKNLDALYDCLTEISEDLHLELRNWHHIEAHLKDYSGKAVYVFHCAMDDNPHLTVTLRP